MSLNAELVASRNSTPSKSRRHKRRSRRSYRGARQATGRLLAQHTAETCGNFCEIDNNLTAATPEQIPCARRFISRERGAPLLRGIFVSVRAMHKSDFFQEQIKKCNRLAEQASNKTDRDFWLRMARRWESMLDAGEHGTLDVEIKPRFERPIIKKRGRRGRRRAA
jgi:hypothetical protein